MKTETTVVERNELWFAACQLGTLMHQLSQESLFAGEWLQSEQVREDCMALMTSVAEAHQVQSQAARQVLLAGALGLLRGLHQHLSSWERMEFADKSLLVDVRLSHERVWDLLAERLGTAGRVSA